MRRRVGAVVVVAGVLAAGGLAAAQTPPPQPTITINPTCDNTRPAAWNIAVNGKMPHTGARVRITFDYGGANPTSAGAGNVQSDFTYTGNIGVKTQPYTGTSWTVAAYEDNGNGPVSGTLVTTTFRSPCTTTTSSSTSTTTSSSTSTTTTTLPKTVATLSVTPALGPSGFVASAHGTGFPPGPIALGWTPGIGGGKATADAAGTFTVAVLILHKDVLGRRTLTAVGGTTSATTTFLVVPSSAQPRTFLARR